jgi:hypothetical protein
MYLNTLSPLIICRNPKDDPPKFEPESRTTFEMLKKRYKLSKLINTSTKKSFNDVIKSSKL